MKNSLLILLLLSLLNLSGQDFSSNAIKVQGRAIYIDPSPIYKVTLSISGSNTSYGYDVMNLEKMIATFKNAIKTEGIRWEELREISYGFGFETLGYEMEGVIYEYKTTSINEIKKILNLKTIGLQRLNAVAQITIGSKEMETLSRIALANAKDKAQEIAKAMGKTLGNIVYVEDRQNVIDIPYESALYYNRPAGQYLHYINVIFETN